MIKENIKIAIIGAGWNGIGCAKILLDKGYYIDIYEKLDDIGGTWHPQNRYASLILHGLAAQSEYWDFPFSESIDRSERVDGQTVFEYLKKYIINSNIHKYIQFNKQVQAIHYQSTNHCVKLDIHDSKTNTFLESIRYDYVIHTDGFTNRNIPTFKNQETFKGEIIHHLDLSQIKLEQLIRSHTQVTVLGGSKSATDCIQSFAKHDYKVRWLYRTPYYFLSYDYIQKIARNRINQKHILKRYPLILLLGVMLSNISHKLPMWLLLLTGKIQTFGQWHFDLKKCHLGLLDKKQMSLIRLYNRDNGIQDEVSHLQDHYIVTGKGHKIPTNTIICCTGSAVSKRSIVDIYIDGKRQDPGQFHHAYRGQVLPEIPTVIFTAYNIMGTGVSGGLNHGLWAAKYIEAKYDIEDIIKKATFYPKPFLLSPALFDRNEYLVTRILDFWNMMLENNELDMSRTEFLDWCFATFCSPYAIKPVQFKQTNSQGN